MAKKRPAAVLKPISLVRVGPFVLMAGVILLFLELVYRHVSGKGVDAALFYYAWSSVASCFVFVSAAKFLSRFVKRPEKYYEREALRHDK